MLTQSLPTCRSVSCNIIHLLRKGLLLSLCALVCSIASWKITMLFSQTPLDARNKDSLKVAGKNQSKSSNGWCPGTGGESWWPQQQEVMLLPFISFGFSLPFRFSLLSLPLLLFSLSCLSLSLLLMHRFCSLRTRVSIMASPASPHIKAFLQQLSPLSYSLGIS